MPPSSLSAPEGFIRGLQDLSLDEKKARMIYRHVRLLKTGASMAEYAESVLNSPIELYNLSLIVSPEPMIIRPKVRRPTELLVAPRLVLNAVTRYLSWEEKTWRQQVIEDTEREIMNPVIGWRVWETIGPVHFNKRALDALKVPSNHFAAKVAASMQLPPVYLGDGPTSTLKPQGSSGDKNPGG